MQASCKRRMIISEAQSRDGLRLGERHADSEIADARFLTAGRETIEERVQLSGATRAQVPGWEVVAERTGLLQKFHTYPWGFSQGP